VSTVAQLQQQLADVQAELGVLRGEVTRLHASKHEVTVVPVNWPTLSTQDAEAVWEVLGRWVQEVLGDWCEVTRDQLPDCWALHRPALMQVSWLWTSHIEAYQPHSRAHAAAEWHTRWLDAALEKIKRVIPASQCHAVAGQQGEHLVHRLQALQQRTRNSHHRAHPLPQQAPYPTTFTPTSPSPDPIAAPIVVTLPAAREIASPGQQVIHRPFWQPYFEQAMQADLTKRRQQVQQ
jgi:hypothetical protein